MKKILLLIFLLSLNLNFVSAQIKTREIKNSALKIYKESKIKLDSTTNIIIYDDIMKATQYIGSKVMFCPYPQNASNRYFDNTLYHYRETNIESLLKVNNEASRSYVGGKILTIDSLIVYKNKYNTQKKYYILSDTIRKRYIWNISDLGLSTSDAILIPYLNYILNKYTGEKFCPTHTLRNTPTNHIYELIDIETGEEINIIPSEIFTCTGVEFVEANYTTPLLNPFLILSSKNKTIRVSFIPKLLGAISSSNEINFRPNINKDFATLRNAQISKERNKEKDDYLKEKYGEQIYNLIKSKTVKIGMSKEACVEAIGKPHKVNKTINSYNTLEQWVYGNGKYLYFNNGILETIQE